MAQPAWPEATSTALELCSCMQYIINPQQMPEETQWHVGGPPRLAKVGTAMSVLSSGPLWKVIMAAMAMNSTAQPKQPYKANFNWLKAKGQGD